MTPSGLQYDAFLEDDVGIERLLAGGDDSVAAARPIVEGEPVDVGDGCAAARVIPPDDRPVCVPDRRLDSVAGDDGHQGGGPVDISIEWHQLQDGVQQFRHAVPVTADHPRVHAGMREIAVADADLIAVAHLHQDLEKLR